MLLSSLFVILSSSWTLVANALEERSGSCATVCSNDRRDASSYCDHYTQTWTKTTWKGTWSKTTTVTTRTTETSTSTTPGGTITTTTCGASASSSGAAVKRHENGKPSCMARYNSWPQMSSACRCVGAPAHQTTVWRTEHPHGTKTVTKTLTTTTTTTVAGPSATVKLPFTGNFYLEATGSGTSADGQYAQVLLGFNKEQNIYYRYATTEGEATIWSLTGTQLIDNEEGEYAAQQSGLTRIEIVSADPLAATLDCRFSGGSLSDCSLECSANGNSVNVLCSSTFVDGQWNLDANAGSCNPFVAQVIPT